MEDNKILQLFNERSELAIMNVQMKYGNYLRTISRNILGDELDAEECVNDTFLKAWNNIPPAKPDNLRTYLGKITRNLSINLFEKNTAKKRGGSQTDLVLEELSEIIPGEGLENVQESKTITSAINKFLENQTGEYRKIFVRRYWYLDSVIDIAKRYHFSESKVKTALFRMRNDLREMLEKEGIEI